MQLLEAETVAEYLQQRDHLAAAGPWTAEELGGGISNRVFRATPTRGGASELVLKQARSQLRTPQPWFCGVERIWREVDFLRAARSLTDQRRFPEVVFEDRENFAFCMTAAPRAAVTWKRRLLAGRLEPWLASDAGTLLGRLHAASWQRAELAARFADCQVFIELRLKPYYEALARAHREMAPLVEALADDVLARPLALVHADFSPKNVLVWDESFLVVDFETGHFGDPAFDLGFAASHFVLKGFRAAPGHGPYLELARGFLAAHDGALGSAVPAGERGELAARGVRHLAACAWARLDGTSQVDYLDEPRTREAVRQLCRWLLVDPPATWDAALERSAACASSLGAGTCDEPSGVC